MAVSYKLKSSNGHPLHLRKPNTWGEQKAVIVPNLRCPHCLHMGAFTAILTHDFIVVHRRARPQQNQLLSMGASTVGLRSCPNPECLGIVLVIAHENEPIVAFPPEVLDFDPSDVPAPIVASLEEAIKCHASQCYKAAALMVRRVLEELCEERGAKGQNLKERVAALASVVVIPQALLDAADHLRLLGNDAAHIEAKTYDAIGESEVRIAIELTKELLKGTYQYKSLLGRLLALQKPT